MDTQEVKLDTATIEMADNLWSDNPARVEQKRSKPNGIELDNLTNPAPPTETVAAPTPKEEKQPEVKKEAEIKQPEPIEKFDANKYIKDAFGFDSEEVAKQQIEKWKKLEAEPKKEPEALKPKFEDAETEKLYNALLSKDKKKVTEILRKQEEIERISELTPLEQIELDLKYKNPKWTKEDVQDTIEEKYKYPNKPDEDDVDYDEKLKAYNKEVAKIDRRIKRDGLEAVENLQKQKSDLVLPDINNQGAEYEKFLQQQKELQVEEDKARESYKNALEKDYSNFTGYKTAYKDKEVDVPIEYKPTETELKQLKEKFANDFDADEYFANRWIKTENNKVVGFNVPLQMEDIHLLENKQKIFDKIANDAAARAVNAYLANEHNINFNKQNDRVRDLGIKAPDEAITDALWK